MTTNTNHGRCADCGAIKTLTARGLCTPCDEEIVFCPANASELLAQAATKAEVAQVKVGEMVEALAEAVTVADFTDIATESTSNAAVQGIGSMAGGQLRGVGFSSKDGYITAIRNGVPAGTHASYLQTLRATYGLTSADITALNLPGPMAESTLPIGPGIKHVPTGPSIFDRPRSERQFKVSAPEEPKAEVARKLDRTDLIAGAIAEGHGVLVCWSGAQRRRKMIQTKSQISRGKIVAALESIGRADLAPNAKSAHAQAGRAVQVLIGRGFDVKAATKESCPDLAQGEVRWTVGRVNHTGAVGEEYGKIALTVRLVDDQLTFDGDQNAAAVVLEDFNARTADDIYQGADVTDWLGNILRRVHSAVEYGLGWYIPAAQREPATKLCAAIAATGFGTSWVGGNNRPALPIATCNELRDGLVRGLIEEVETVLDRLATEREAAKDARKSGDIGERRAATFLGELREITKRIAAYGEMMGAERVAAAREQVRLAIVELEEVLGDDYTGIGERFALIADECAFDARPAPKK